MQPAGIRWRVLQPPLPGFPVDFRANFIPSGIDPLLQSFTQEAAQLVNPEMLLNPLNNWGFYGRIVYSDRPGGLVHHRQDCGTPAAGREG